jgi:hypothetical protein
MQLVRVSITALAASKKEVAMGIFIVLAGAQFLKVIGGIEADCC